MMDPNFLYSNSYHFSTLLLLLLSFLFYYYPFISHWAAKLPSQLFYNISKQNLINILFHRGDFMKD